MKGSLSKRSLGKYCVAGAPGNVSCENNSETESVSRHIFLSNETYREKWISYFSLRVLSGILDSQLQMPGFQIVLKKQKFCEHPILIINIL